MELKLPIKPGKKPLKQMPRLFASKVIFKIKEEIERPLKSKFIRTARYVEWLANIVPVIKKNRTLRVYIDFKYLSVATPKDEYPIHVVKSWLTRQRFLIILVCLMAIQVITKYLLQMKMC